jgi:hypothetical protein
MYTPMPPQHPATERESRMWVTNLLPPNFIDSSAEGKTHDMVVHPQNLFSSHGKYRHGGSSRIASIRY